MKIILFDGECNVCNKSVQFIIQRDRDALFHFAPLQSDIDQELLALNHLQHDIDNLVFIDENRAYTASSAVLHICKYLPAPWKVLYTFVIIPPFIRNIAYRFFAKHRHKIIRTNHTCLVVTPEIKKRFLT